MPQSLSQVYVHAVFSTKDRKPLIVPEFQRELYPYLGGVAKTNGLIPVLFGGTDDHVHLLFGMSRTITMAKAIEFLKTSSSKWAKEKFEPQFSWQTGYGIFGVSYRELSAVEHYIANQEEHHRRVSFQDEYRALLAEQGIVIDEKYLWD